MRRVALVLISLLAAITAALWITSHFWIIHLELPGRSPDTVITVEPMVGRVLIWIIRYSPPPTQRGPAISLFSISEVRAKIEVGRTIGIMMDWLDDRPSFEWHTFALPPIRGVTWSGRKITFPYWLPFAILSAWPVCVAAVWLYRRRPIGRCCQCGYDLRASPSGVCPECGTVNQPPPLTSDARDGK